MLRILHVFCSFCLIGLTATLTCYDCDYSAWPIEQMPTIKCSNSELPADFITPCSAQDKFCTTEITTVNKVFKGVNRRCAVDCQETCQSNGFGVDIVTCASCCSTNACNNEYKVSFYETIMERQYHSYFKAFPNEKMAKKLFGSVWALLFAQIVVIFARVFA